MMFYFVFFLIVFAIVSTVSATTFFRKLPNEVKKLENRNMVTQTKSTEVNVPAPNVSCSYEATNKLLYSAIPEITIEHSLAVPFEYKFENVKLLLSNEGHLEYFIDNVLIWSTKNPHSYVTNLSVSVMLKDFKESMIVDMNDIELHMYPLRLMYQGRIIWGFWGGYDPTSLCDSSQECVIPVRDTAKGKVFLFSDNRKFRISLHENGDFIILKTSADEKDMFKWVKKIEHSFIEDYCSLK